MLTCPNCLKPAVSEEDLKSILKELVCEKCFELINPKHDEPYEDE